MVSMCLCRYALTPAAQAGKGGRERKRGRSCERGLAHYAEGRKSLQKKPPPSSHHSPHSLRAPFLPTQPPLSFLQPSYTPCSLKNAPTPPVQNPLSDACLPLASHPCSVESAAHSSLLHRTEEKTSQGCNWGGGGSSSITHLTHHQPASSSALSPATRRDTTSQTTCVGGKGIEGVGGGLGEGWERKERGVMREGVGERSRGAGPC